MLLNEILVRHVFAIQNYNDDVSQNPKLKMEDHFLAVVLHIFAVVTVFAVNVVHLQQKPHHDEFFGTTTR